MSGRLAEVRRLHRARPRRRFVTRSVAVLALIIGLSWLGGDFQATELLGSRQQVNAARFLSELRPWPLQQPGAPDTLPAQLTVAVRWFGRMWQQKGAAAVATTLAISLVAILLSGVAGGLLSLPAARNFAVPQPFLPGGRRPSRVRIWLWRAVFGLTRGLLTVVRAVPEYIWAFLLLAVLGPTVWPLILALALHNTGSLGKLTADVIENVDPRVPRALRGAGAGRLAIVGAALVPLCLPRFLLYFFYRWEICVRESTVLGMLGIASLGFWIVDARARTHYDEMLFFVICGMALVLLGDLVSAAVRHVVRRA